MAIERILCAPFNSTMGNAPEDSFEDVFWRLQEEVGPDHVRLEPLLLEMADRDEERGRFVRARALVRRVIAMRSARLGSDHPTVRSLVPRGAIPAP
jgi:hypothetical protein